MKIAKRAALMLEEYIENDEGLETRINRARKKINKNAEIFVAAPVICVNNSPISHRFKVTMKS